MATLEPRRQRRRARAEARRLPPPWLDFVPLRGAGPVAVALTAWDIWRRIPKQHRKLIVHQARKHGPRVAAKLMEQRQRRRPRS